MRRASATNFLFHAEVQDHTLQCFTYVYNAVVRCNLASLNRPRIMLIRQALPFWRLQRLGNTAMFTAPWPSTCANQSQVRARTLAMDSQTLADHPAPEHSLRNQTALGV